MIENEISHEIIRAAIQVHKTVGPGLLEHVYEKLLAYELHKAGLSCLTQVAIPVIYEGNRITEIGFRADMIVNDKVLVEIKSVECLAPVHHKQVHTYLKLSDIRLGLLINFNQEIVTQGVKRIANNL